MEGQNIELDVLSTFIRNADKYFKETEETKKERLIDQNEDYAYIIRLMGYRFYFNDEQKFNDAINKLFEYLESLGERED